MNVDRFETERLMAVRLSDEHLELSRALFQDPAVAATLGGVLSDYNVGRAMIRNLDHWRQYGFGIWMFFLKSIDSTGEFIGRCGIRWTEIDDRDEVELAYTIVANKWNQGFATEMSEAVLDVGFRLLELDDVVCFTLTTNIASRRVMEKLGFAQEENVVHFDLPHVCRRLTRSRFNEL